jgi:multiple sugar transport system substrate-binding protein
MAKRSMNRREFLSMSAVAAAGAAVAGCAAPPAQVVEKVITSAPEVIEKVVTSEPQVVEKTVEKVITATPEPAKYPAGQVTLWSWGTPQYQEDWMNDFLLTHYPGSGIKGVAQGTQGAEDIQTKLMLSYSAGCADCPDFVQSDAPVVKPMADAGAILELTEWTNTFKDKMPDGIFDSFTFDGKVWCFPWRPNTWLMYYNREIFDKAGIKADQIKTWDEWLQAGIDIKKATNGESFLEYRDGSSGWFTYDILVPQNGGRYFDNNFNPVLDTDEKTIEAFMLQEKMYKAEVLYMTSSWNPGWYQAMKDGKFAAMLYGNWWDEFLKKNLPDMSGKWGIMDVPAFANGVHKVPMAAVPFCIVNKPDAAYRDLIMEMLQWQFLDRDRVLEYLHLMTNRNLTAFLPVLKEVYNDPFFTQPDPYYADQSFQAEVVKSTQETPTDLPLRPDRLPEVSSIIGAEVDNVYAGKQDMMTALKNASAQLLAKQSDIIAASK